MHHHLSELQTVMHTKILPTTHYRELPERARREINQVEVLIADVSQRCDYIGKQAAPILQHRMEGTRHDQEMMHYVSVKDKSKWTQ
jgi:excinuclease UvrABC helicase subunit UvrB